jgi:hypothetical protein
MKIKIRKAQLDELRQLLDLFQIFNTFGRPPKKVTLFVKKYFAKILANENNFVFVAEIEKRIVGSIQFDNHRRDRARHSTVGNSLDYCRQN